ncbi:MAG TPA: hypothetical protein VN577_14865 [Terriglobales bacterium]|nr:hypothetical protein [Terriglobales bacterium]
MATGIQIEHVDEAEKAFERLVTSQVARVTQELQKLELMLAAGMVDPLVLREFRKTIDQVRKTSWHVHQVISAKETELPR